MKTFLIESTLKRAPYFYGASNVYPPYKPYEGSNKKRSPKIAIIKIPFGTYIYAPFDGIAYVYKKANIVTIEEDSSMLTEHKVTFFNIKTDGLFKCSYKIGDTCYVMAGDIIGQSGAIKYWNSEYPEGTLGVSWFHSWQEPNHGNIHYDYVDPVEFNLKQVGPDIIP